MAENDDDESWLYGDVEQSEKKEEAEEKSVKEEAMDTLEAVDNAHATAENNDAGVASSLSDGELVDKDTENETDNDKNAVEDVNRETKDKDVDSDSDDDVQVTIGEITTGNTPNFPQSNHKSFYRNPVALPIAPKPIVKGLDINTPGDINGSAVLDFNLDSLDDKPWTKPGADLSDYFNYGFNEPSWRLYCDKQKRLRSGENATVLSIPHAKPLPLTNLSNIFGTPKLQRQYNPIRPFENTVQTISTLQVSRRKGDELSPGTAPPGEAKTPVSTDTTLNSPSSNTTTPKPATSLTFPPPTIQPPTMSQPPMFPPINRSQPPPGMPLGVPPPGFPMPGVLPPGMPPMPGMVLPGMPPRGFPGMPMMPQQFYDPNVEGMQSDGKHDDGRYSDEDGHYRRERSLSSRRDDRDRDRDRRDYRDREKRDRYRERDRGRDRDRDRERSERDRSERPERDRSERGERDRSDRGDRDRPERGERDRSERRDRDHADRSERSEHDRERDQDRERDPERAERERPERESSRRHRDDGQTHKSSRRHRDEDDERYSSSKHKKSKKHKHKEKELAAPGTEEVDDLNGDA